MTVLQELCAEREEGMAGACAELSAAAAVSAAASVTKRGKPRRASWDTELQRARRATVARSWCAGYGALAEEEEDVAEPVRRCGSRDLVMPSLKNLVSMATLSRRRSSSTTALNSQSREVPRMPAAKSVAALPLLRETALTLSSVQVRPVNRLRLGSSKMCSRCSSILSMASSSRYSINTAGFVQLSQPDCRTVLCKLCLLEVPPHLTWTLQHCACTFCVEVSRTCILLHILIGLYLVRVSPHLILADQPYVSPHPILMD